MKLLIVDDDFVSITKLTTILIKYAECTVATHATQAFELIVESVKANDVFDLIIVDINLPDIDGFELVRKVNYLENSRNIAHIKKVMITSDGNIFNVRRANEYNVDSFLVKPTRKEIIIKKLQDLEIIPSDKKKILIPERQTEVDKMIAEILSQSTQKNKKEKYQIKQEIRFHKKDIFQLCMDDKKMLSLLDAITDNELWRILDESENSDHQ